MQISNALRRKHRLRAKLRLQSIRGLLKCRILTQEFLANHNLWKKINMRHSARLLKVALVIACLLAASSAHLALCDGAGKVEILRDEWGVPHVFADTDAGAMYGLGYVTAEDRAFQMHYSLRIIQGRLAELIGDVKKIKLPVSSVLNDEMMRTIGYARYAERIAANLDPETQRLLQAYSDGVNDYIDRNPDKLSHMFKKIGLEPERWTPADCLLSWWHLGLFFTKSGLRDTRQYHSVKDGKWSPSKTVVDDSAAVVRRTDVSEEWVRKTQEFAESHGLSPRPVIRGDSPEFSNAWAAGGKKTGTGAAALVSDPKTPVTNPSLWYQFHLSGKTFNTRGIGVPGSPIILIGWNENVAWGGTALGLDQVDLFVLKTDEEHPDQYMYDGKWRDMQVYEETIRVKGTETKTIRARETHLGPVVTSFAVGAQPGEEIAMKRIPLAELDRETIQGALAMMRAKNVTDFLKAQEGWRFPGLHSVCGDSQGSIGYRMLAAVPVRSRFALNNGESAHEGWLSKNDWQGILPYDLLPTVVNPDRGYIAIANHRPIASFYPLPLGLSSHSAGDSTRAFRLRERLEANQCLSPEEVFDIHFDSVNPVPRDYVRFGYHLRDVQKAKLSPEALQTLKHLEKWYENGAKSDLTADEFPLVNCIDGGFKDFGGNPMIKKYGYKGPGQCLFLKVGQARLDKGGEAAFPKDEIDHIDKVLSNAWKSAVHRYGQDTSTWSDKARQATRNKKLGYYQSLDRFPSLDPEQDLPIPALTRLDGSTPGSQTGQSYTQFVPLHDVDAARSILPIGQSEQPGSPWRTTNMQAWQQSRLHPAPITHKAVEPYVTSATRLTYPEPQD